jgi:hypothetical protein
MKSLREDLPRSERFSLFATKNYLILLTSAYFFLSSAIAHYLFGDVFYIYSIAQPMGDVLSVVFGLIVVGWIYLVFPRSISKTNPLIIRISKLHICPISYWIYLSYLGAAILYGLSLRMHGAGRLDLLSGEDNFLLPGLGYILTCCGIHCIRSRSSRPLTYFVLLSLFTDAVFGGKIFSFIAVGLVFMRLDYLNLPAHKIRRIFIFVCCLGIVLITLTSVSRTLMAGESLKSGLLPEVYLAAEEFMGVQASTGWAVSYYADHLPSDLVHFVYTLQDYYIASVGHGLGVSPTAWFVGNFGNWGILVGTGSLLGVAALLRWARRYLSWIVILILSLNYQHFLRHGFNIFLQKFIAQIVFFVILDQMAALALISQTSSTPSSIEAGGSSL